MKEKIITTIEMPGCSMAYGFTCHDCLELNVRDRNRNGEVWCEHWGKYIDPSNPCRFLERNDR